MYPFFGIKWQVTRIGHHVDSQVCDLDQCLCIGVQQDGSVEQKATQLEKGMQRQSGHVRFRPTTTSFFHVFFELDPTYNEGKNKEKYRVSLVSREKKAILFFGWLKWRCNLPSRFVPLDFSGVVIVAQFFHFRKERMRFVSAIVTFHLLTQDKLDSLWWWNSR